MDPFALLIPTSTSTPAYDGNDDVDILVTYGTAFFVNRATYSTGYNPVSVAVGDFNNDTRLDIVVANYFDKDVSVLLGYFNIRFAKQTALSTSSGSRPRSFAIGDFNNDNRMDIAVAYSGTHNIGIFLGYGNISFGNQVTYSTGLNSSPYSVAAGDFNNDTWLDIVVVNYGSENMGVFLGYGNGSFTNQVTYSTGSGSYPYSVVVGHFDNDNTVDIVIANYGSSNLRVFRGYGNGTFTSVLSFSMGYESHPFFIVAGYFNNDTKLDLAVANNGTDS